MVLREIMVETAVAVLQDKTCMLLNLLKTKLCKESISRFEIGSFFCRQRLFLKIAVRKVIFILSIQVNIVSLRKISLRKFSHSQLPNSL